MSRITEFYRISPPAAVRHADDEAARSKYYRRLRLQAFTAATLGYSLYYVCRTSLNVMKKPILDSGSLDASQLGVIGSALLFAYAVGKFVNGFMRKYSCNFQPRLYVKTNGSHRRTFHLRRTSIKHKSAPLKSKKRREVCTAPIPMK